MSLFWLHRKFHPKHAAFSLAAMYGDGTAVCRADGFHNGKAEASATQLTRAPSPSFQGRSLPDSPASVRAPSQKYAGVWTHPPTDATAPRAPRLPFSTGERVLRRSIDHGTHTQSGLYSTARQSRNQRGTHRRDAERGKVFCLGLRGGGFGNLLQTEHNALDSFTQ